MSSLRSQMIVLLAVACLFVIATPTGAVPVRLAHRLAASSNNRGEAAIQAAGSESAISGSDARGTCRCDCSGAGESKVGATQDLAIFDTCANACSPATCQKAFGLKCTEQRPKHTVLLCREPPAAALPVVKKSAAGKEGKCTCRCNDASGREPSITEVVVLDGCTQSCSSAACESAFAGKCGAAKPMHSVVSCREPSKPLKMEVTPSRTGKAGKCTCLFRSSSPSSSSNTGTGEFPIFDSCATSCSAANCRLVHPTKAQTFAVVMPQKCREPADSVKKTIKPSKAGSRGKCTCRCHGASEADAHIGEFAIDSSCGDGSACSSATCQTNLRAQCTTQQPLFSVVACREPSSSLSHGNDDDEDDAEDDA